MKVLVGIMYCIENEFQACIDSVKEQTHRNFDYFVIENLPNREAHDQLYNRFTANASGYDIFIKIDADMVLCRTTYFEEVIREFSLNPKLELLQVAVHDFFTDQLIFGQHNYRNTVRWNIEEEKIFTDRQNVSGQIINDSNHLAPAAFHCPDPSFFQSFHFGIHKAVKVMQIGSRQKSIRGRDVHWDNIQKMKNHYRRTKDRRVGYAVLGSEMAFNYKYTYQRLDYSDSILNQQFDMIKDLSVDELEELIQANTIYNSLPSLVRLALISLFSEYKSVLQIPKKLYHETLKNTLKRILTNNKNTVK